MSLTAPGGSTMLLDDIGVVVHQLLSYTDTS
jgi:hypothetical protein